MLGSVNQLFNRKMLNAALERFDLARIPGLQQKQQILVNWKQAVTSNTLKTAGEVSIHGDFLIDMFSCILGYKRMTEAPEEWNLAHEQKTLLDATKADGALGFFTKETADIRAIIELKKAGTDLDAKQHRTQDKRSPVEQAFGYVPKSGKRCVWVLVSNYEELRLYRANTMAEYECFKIAALTDEDEFRRFYYLLACQHLLAKIGESVVETLYRQSAEAEQRITAQFYADYTNARRQLFDHLKAHNPDRADLALLAYTQQLLDRFIFICFCEDTSDLLPQKTFRNLIQRTQDSIAMGYAYGKQRVWTEVKGLFRALNEGLSEYNIPGFNGELFEPDPEFETLHVEDDIFLELAKITDYDFQSELNINILGHIFEQSITDLEELRAEIQGTPLDRKQGKRKKEGIFYTPEYITRYIVEQAVGGWLAERQRELGIDDLPELRPEDEVWLASNAKKKKPNERVARQIAFWEQYLECLKRITILDPACGSGAFLTQAFDFLRREGEQVNRTLNRLRPGEQLGLFERKTWDRSILRNNLFGVDVNPESVEITKLALWLKTAKKDDQLTALDKNIKCGNSLIDDPLVVGEKAFKWEQEFPEIMERGGFDVVISNPPYGAKLKTEERAFLENRYQCFQGNFDIYTAFIELAFTKLSSNGYWGYITPVSWQSGDNYLRVRQYLRDTGMLKIGLKLPYDTFSETYVDTGIYVIQKKISPQYDSQVYEFPIRYDVNEGFSSKINFSHLPSTYWQTIPTLKIVLNPDYYELLPKIATATVKLGDITNSVRGILPNKSDVKDEKADDLKKYFVGTLYRYIMSEEFRWVTYGDNLREFPQDYSYFCGERILVRRLISRQFRVMATYVNVEFVNKKDLYNVKVINPAFDIKYLLTIINSKLVSYLKTKGSTTATKDDFSQLTLADIRDIPIKQIPLTEQHPFIEKADKMLELNKQSYDTTKKFLRFIESSYHPKKLSTRLETYYTLSFSDFTAELNKQKVSLSKQAEFELMDLFEAQKSQALSLQQQIEQTDNEIDRMVYELYGLTEEEVRIVEGK